MGEYETRAGKRADKILSNIEGHFANPGEKSVFRKSLKERTKNEHLAVSLGCDPDADCVGKARNPEQLQRMDLVRRLETVMKDSVKYGGNPDTTKRQIASIYGIDPTSATYHNCTDANDMRRAALVKLLEGVREQVTRVDCDDLFDQLLDIIKRGKNI